MIHALALDNPLLSAVHLGRFDWLIIAVFLFISLAIGIAVARRSGRDTSQYFLSGRSMPWWLLGISIVATTFATDTPNLVTGLVRQGGVANNWIWWAFLLTGMMTVFIYARLWRRTGVLTDLEFYELRYSGKAAVFLRGFRALYLGLLFNVIVMANVTLAAIKIGNVLLDLNPTQTVLIAAVITMVFSALGGFRGVILTDFILFCTAMTGATAAAYFAVSQAGGLEPLMQHPAVSGKLALFPDPQDHHIFLKLLVIPLAVQWWAAWYPGAEPGGGGYVAQRMLAARTEGHAVGATLFFNIAHYALRPWPWILVALASLIVYPDLASLKEAFPNMPEQMIKHDMAYPAMLTFVPAGWLGLILASLIAAYMSTISTQLNWGSSYIVNDFYRRFLRPHAHEREYVWIGRLTNILLMTIGALLAMMLESATQLFDIIIMFGAGTGLIFILRWFWWRVNAPAEVAAMFGSGTIALTLAFTPVGELIPELWHFPVAVLASTAIWAITMYLTRPTAAGKLQSFYAMIQPGGPGWPDWCRGKVIDAGNHWLHWGLLSMLLASLLVYSALFGIGYLLYGWYGKAVITGVIAVVSGYFLYVAWRKQMEHLGMRGEVQQTE